MLPGGPGTGPGADTTLCRPRAAINATAKATMASAASPAMTYTSGDRFTGACSAGFGDSFTSPHFGHCLAPAANSNPHFAQFIKP